MKPQGKKNRQPPRVAQNKKKPLIGVGTFLGILVVVGCVAYYVASQYRKVDVVPNGHNVRYTPRPINQNEPVHFAISHLQQNTTASPASFVSTFTRHRRVATVEVEKGDSLNDIKEAIRYPVLRNVPPFYSSSLENCDTLNPCSQCRLR